MENNRLLIAYYGDDFTGSTDALEFLCRSGIKTMLFIDVPTVEQLRQYPELQAIGVAGISRTMSPGAMDEHLTPAFEALRKINPMHVHYKVCSTFDSSPTIGSIGKAIDIGSNVFNSRLVPLLVAAPILGRYCLFGNLFARMGIGSEGNIYRLDRHPSMSKHPTTPADESDLRLHLAKQTTKSIGLFDILSLHQYQEKATELSFGSAEIIVFDAVKQEDLAAVGQIIDSLSNKTDVLFSAGSSGIEMALGMHWKENSLIHEKIEPELPTSVSGLRSTVLTTPIIVASGSCSAVTSAQINFALADGFKEIAIDTVKIAEHLAKHGLEDSLNLINQMVEVYVTQALVLLEEEKSLIIHTSLGNDDHRVIATSDIFKNMGGLEISLPNLYGSFIGKIVRSIVEKRIIERVIVAGGDTSSYAARAMGIEAVEMIAPLTPGAPLCIAHAPNSSIDKLQVVFKGGQVGKEDFFVAALDSSLRSE